MSVKLIERPENKQDNLKTETSNDREIKIKDIANILIASPFTKEGRAYYAKCNKELFNNTELCAQEWRKRFLEEIYAEPYFINYKYEDSFDDELNEGDMVKRYDADHICKIRESYDKFTEDLIGDDYTENSLVKSLYVVIGAVWCGKSIFTQKLLSEKEEIIHSFIENFELCSSNLTKFAAKNYSISTRNRGVTVTPIDAFTLLLLRNIGKCFCKPNVADELDYPIENLRETIFDICDIYTQYFGVQEDSEWCENFFSRINEIATDDESTITIISNILDYIDKKIVNIISIKDENGTLVRLMDILLRLYFCMTKLNGGIYEGKKLVLFIDNIESALTKNGQNKALIGIKRSDIKKFLIASHESARKFSDILAKIRGVHSKEKNPAAIILAMRDCTFGILEDMRSNELIDLHANTYMTCVEIAEWFDDEHILTNRIKFFTGYDSLEKFLENKNTKKSEGVIAYINVITDRSKFSWGLNDFVSHFYNCSKRLVHRRFIGKFLKYYEKYKKRDLKFFNQKWAELNALNKTDIGYTATKQLCRKYMIRLLMDYVNTDVINPFKQNHELTKNECSYARRVLSYLSNNTESNISVENKIIFYYDYVGVGKLIDDLVVCGRDINSKEIELEIEMFSDIICELNYSLVNWAGLIYIQVPDGGIFLPHDLLKYVKHSWKVYKKYKETGSKFTHGYEEMTAILTKIDNNLKRGVDLKLTLAGNLYARFMPEFESFACRYCKSDVPRPLLAVKDDKTLIKVLKRVFEETEKCLKKVVSIEESIDSDYTETWNYGNRKYHERLIAIQKGYLVHFKVYLDSKIANDIPPKVKECMKLTIENKFYDYDELLKKLNKKQKL